MQNTVKKEDFTQLFERFYNEYYVKAFRYANSFVFDQEVSKDIVSDSMLRIWEKRFEIDPDKSLCSLLYVTIRNKCLDHLRHQTVLFKTRNQQVLTASSTAARLNDFVTESTVLSDYYSSELTQMVRKVVDSMHATTRTCFLMIRLNGKSYQEVADILKISTRSVEYELNKAARIMRTELKDYLER